MLSRFVFIRANILAGNLKLVKLGKKTEPERVNRLERRVGRTGNGPVADSVCLAR